MNEYATETYIINAILRLNQCNKVRHVNCMYNKERETDRQEKKQTVNRDRKCIGTERA